MATNNNGHALDSAGNVQVDFVWGNMARQPNDVRTGSTSADSYYNVTSAVGDNAVTNGSKRVVPRLDNHDVILGGYSGYPLYSNGVKDTNGFYQGNAGSFRQDFSGTTLTPTVSTASIGDTTITVSSAAGITVGLGVSAIGKTTAGTFVTSVSGTTIGLSQPLVGAVASSTTFTFGSDSSITYTPFITVPSVIGLNGTATAITIGTGTLAAGGAADALRDAGYQNANIKVNGTAATNTATQPTQINVTSATAATINVTGGTGTWPVNSYITLASGIGVPTALVGNWQVTGGTSSTLVISGVANTVAGTGNSTWTVANSGAITPGTVLTGLTGSVKTQSVAANAPSIDGTADITITNWA